MTLRFLLLAAAATLLIHGAPAFADSAAAPLSDRDGQRDFDWMHGNWKATLKKLVKPLSGSKEWIEFEGTQTTRILWDGKANIDEFVVHNPEKKIDIQGITLRLYNPEKREWSLYWASAKSGVLAMPPTVGRFDGKGRGEFYDREDWEGKPIIVRYTWSGITKTSAHFEQAFSPDDGKTWEVNWISDLTRLP